MRFGPLIIAVVLALVAGFVALKMIGGNEPEQPTVTQTSSPLQTETTEVYIASQFIPIGTVISSDMVNTQPWPANLVSDAFVTNQQPVDAVVGKISRSSFQQGEPIALTKIAGADEGSFLAGSLPKGMRAVTINTDETYGVAGFVFPGDRVDILMTHPVPKWDKLTRNAGTENVAETLLINVPVLAVDQIANAQEIAANSDQQQGGEEASTIHVSRTVTLMVNLVDGEKLRLGEKVGQLSMALRSVEDRETVDMASLLRYQNITQFPLDSVVAAAGGDAAAGEGGGVRVIRGVEAMNVSPLAAPVDPAAAMLANPLLPMTAAVTPTPNAEGAATQTPATTGPSVVIPQATAPEASLPDISPPSPLPAPPSATPNAAATQ